MHKYSRRSSAQHSYSTLPTPRGGGDASSFEEIPVESLNILSPKSVHACGATFVSTVAKFEVMPLGRLKVVLCVSMANGRFAMAGLSCSEEL